MQDQERTGAPPALARIKRLASLLARPTVVRQLLALGSSGYLVDSGWVCSVEKRLPVNVAGRPIPWVTLPFVDFIEGRLKRNIRMFEYGSGNSTMFYAQYVEHLDTVEHDQAWFRQMQDSLPSNARISWVALDHDGHYARTAQTTGDRYHVVVVDGRDRVNCIRYSLASLAEDGCLVLDDSEREAYLPGCRLLAEAGFRRLDFWGMAPGLNYKKCTSVFYRADNCLSI